MHESGTSKEKGYELSDIQIRLVLLSGVGVVLMTVAAYVISVFFIKYLEASGSFSDYEPSPMAGETMDWDLDVRLQPDPPRALDAHRESQAYASDSYGRVSESPEVYHIPIETAMDIVAERGLPTFELLAPVAEEH